VTGLAALVAAVNVRKNVPMTETGIGTETEITGMIGTEDEGVVLPLSRGDALPVPTGG